MGCAWKEPARSRSPTPIFTAVSIGRGTGDRLGGRTTVVLSRRTGRPLWIAPVAQHAALLELHDRVSALVR